MKKGLLGAKPDVINADVQKNVLLASILKTWGFHLNLRTPDFDALKIFLDKRYNIFSDDVPHDDIFGFVEPD